MLLKKVSNSVDNGGEVFVVKAKKKVKFKRGRRGKGQGGRGIEGGHTGGDVGDEGGGVVRTRRRKTRFQLIATILSPQQSPNSCAHYRWLP